MSRAAFAGLLAVGFAVSAALPFVLPLKQDRVYLGTDTRAA
jgi:hypothetical protein